jgi:hypothetical protein
MPGKQSAPGVQFAQDLNISAAPTRLSRASGQWWATYYRRLGCDGAEIRWNKIGDLFCAIR